MALSPHPWVALVALVTLVTLRGTLVASTRQICHLGTSGDTVRDAPEPGALQVTNGEAWGQWGDTHYCPSGSMASGIQIKVQAYQGFFKDDTGLNGLRLLCDTGTDTVTSSVGPLGSWATPVLCPQGEHLVSFRLRVEPSRGLWDDAGATDAAALCSGGSVLQGGGLVSGDWGDWSRKCPGSCGVCGVRTRLDPADPTDATGVTDVKLYCCSR